MINVLEFWIVIQLLSLIFRSVSIFGDDFETKHFVELNLILVIFPNSSFCPHGINLHPFESSDANDEEEVKEQEVLCKSPSVPLRIGAGVQQDKTNQHEAHRDT